MMLRGLNTKPNSVDDRHVYHLAFACQLCQPLGRKGFCIRRYFIYP